MLSTFLINIKNETVSTNHFNKFQMTFQTYPQKRFIYIWWISFFEIFVLINWG